MVFVTLAKDETRAKVKNYERKFLERQPQNITSARYLPPIPTILPSPVSPNPRHSQSAGLALPLAVPPLQLPCLHPSRRVLLACAVPCFTPYSFHQAPPRLLLTGCPGQPPPAGYWRPSYWASSRQLIAGRRSHPLPAARPRPTHRPFVIPVPWRRSSLLRAILKLGASSYSRTDVHPALAATGEPRPKLCPTSSCTHEQ